MKALLGISLLLAADSVFACKCPQYSLPEQQSHADAVFVGSTQSSPSEPGKQGETISFKVSRGIKGVLAGSNVAVDPNFESDCTARFQPDIQVLVFAYKASGGTLTASACSVRAAEPISIGGRTMQPAPETLRFLKSGT